MSERINYKMPSTTNSLESTHGHLNKKTPRNNGFYMSLFRLIKNISIKAQKIDNSIKSNYNRAKNFSINYATVTSDERMRAEMVHYNTTIDSCECSENKLLSAMMNIDIPCSHRYKMGKQFPECPFIKPVIKPQNEKLEIIYNVLPIDQNAARQNEDFHDKQYVIGQIRRFSHFSNKDKIAAFVDSRFPLNQHGKFICKRSEQLMRVICDGIIHFTALKAEESKKE